MTTTGLEVFDKTVQTTNIWLREIMEELGPDRHRAFHALGAVLHTLRDRLTVEESAHLSAQLPMLVRGLFFHNWQPTRQPTHHHHAEEFLADIQARLHDVRPLGAEAAAKAVFRVLDRHVARGEMDDVRAVLPADIRRLWPEPAEQTGRDRTPTAGPPPTPEDLVAKDI